MEPASAETLDSELPDESFEGDLGLGTLPGLVRRLHEDRRSGILRLLVAGAERRVFYKWGSVIFASSDRKDDRLDQCLLKEGKVSSSTLLLAYESQKETGRRFGECLVEMGALSEGELLAAVERQVRAIVTFLFSMTKGHYRFEPTDEPVDDDLMLDLPMDEILLDGVRSISDPIALRIGVGTMTHYLHPGRDRRGAMPSVNAAEGFVLSRVDGRTMIVDHLSLSPMSDLETLQSVCALLSVGIVEARADALPAEPPPISDETSPKSRPERAQSTARPPEQVRGIETTRELSADEKRETAAERYAVGRRLFLEKQYHEAIGVLMEAVRLDHTKGSYQRLLGEAYAMNPKWKAMAIEHLRQAVSIDASDIRAHWLLGVLLEERNRADEARSHFEAVVSLEPGHEGAESKLARGGVVSRLTGLFRR